MTHEANPIGESDDQVVLKMILDSFRGIVMHYGMWFGEASHQLGLERALKLEEEVWNASMKNQLTRLGKTLGFPVKDGVPEALLDMPRDRRMELIKSLAVNWLANDGIWFQAVEKKFGMFDAKRCNDTCWGYFSPFEAGRIKRLLGLGDNGGLPALKKALGFRMYAVINEQTIEDEGENAIVFKMVNCRVQAARKRKNMDDYPCKSGGVVEYTRFAEAVDPRIRTECVGCPPDDHPDEWFCAWRFFIE
ncbi:Cytosolic protein [Candidatus Desulfarcum epimagneticum]|uniref:Cytosolic protein n=1 Tax=uncultured Desulfobacteraceae bacterium TaxID=218296 RepID=A0A484HCH2_9BACT|nr:Cytosolic protein [uncultured Desulfobacteraceae bacterium]